jgi:alpha-beta hydrolase superfamily lysophospholipase
MQHKESTFTGHDNLELYYQSWHPDTEPKATLIIVHGLGEHSGRYINLVNPLVADNYAVYAFDNRGHGRSPGKQGYVNSFDEYRQDVMVFQKLVMAAEGERPLFIMGHSLGGLITLYTILHDSTGYNGAIISAPALDTGGVSALLMAASKILSRLKPDFSVATGLDATGISRDPEVVKAYQADPLVHGVGTPRLSRGKPRRHDLVRGKRHKSANSHPHDPRHRRQNHLTRQQPRLLRQANSARQNLYQLRRRLPRKPQRHPPPTSRRRHSKLARRPSLKNLTQRRRGRRDFSPHLRALCG